MLSADKWEQYGIAREQGTYGIHGITIHEFNDSSKTAEDIQTYLENECKENEGYHYAVDSENIVQLMPLNYAVYHTGKMMDWGDEHTIAIAICNNLNEDAFEANVENALTLVSDLMEEYDLMYKDLFFHNDFNKKVHCPDHLLNMYNSSAGFAYYLIGIPEDNEEEEEENENLG